MSGAILCIDDEPRVLESLENHLALEWDVVTATSGVAGLAALGAQPFAVVMSDMRMPGMNGAAFLARVRELYPDTTRVLLTGHSDLHDAASAINDGNVFRFLLKPCATADLLRAVADAFRQHELVRTEKLLLEQTLQSTVGVLTEILGVVHPIAFGTSNRIAAMVRHAIARLALPDAWQIELAAMLSQLGCIMLDGDLITKAHAGTLSSDELATYRGHAMVARRMLEKIPRLDGVAAIVGDQFGTTCEHAAPTIQLGSQLLQVANRIDARMRGARDYAAALQHVLAVRTWDPRLGPAFANFRASSARRLISVAARDLEAEMTLEADVSSPRGERWMLKGTALTAVAANRLRSLAERGLVSEPVLVSLA
ncbi:MAG: response regulator [Kofleriaceae bacterium]